MIAKLRLLFTPPVFENDADMSRTARLLASLLVIILCAIPIYDVILLLPPRPAGEVLSALLTFVNLCIPIVFLIAYLMRRRKVRLASGLMILLGWTAVSHLALLTGAHDTSMSQGFVIVVLAAGLLLGVRAFLITFAACMVTGFIIVFTPEAQTLTRPFEFSRPHFWFISSLFFAIAGGIVYLATRYTREDLKRAQIELTERKRAEHSLRFTQATVEGSAQPIFWIRPDGTIDFANAAAARLLGLSAEDIVGKHTWEIDRNMSPDYWMDLWDDVRTSGAEMIEYELRTVDGHTVLLEVENNYIAFEDSEYNVAYARDVTEQRRAEEEIRDSQHRLERLIEQSPLGIIEWDSEWRIAAWNPAAERIFGWTQEEVLHEKAAIIVPPDAMTHVERIWSDLIAQRGGRRSTNENLTKDGKRIMCEWYNSPLVDAQDNIFGVVSAVDDISEQLAIETALVESEKRFRALIENSSDAIVLLSADGSVVYHSPAVEKMLGFSGGDIDGRNFFDFLFPTDREDGAAAFKTLLRVPEGTKAIGFRMVTRAGAVRWVESTGTNLLEEPAVQAVVFNFRDTTEQTLAEEATREWKHRYDLIVASSGQVAYEYNVLTGWISWSDSVQSVFGYEPDELTGGVEQWVELIHPDDRGNATARLAESKQKLVPYEAEYRFRQKGGEYLWIFDRGFFVPDRRGMVVRLLGMMTDVTERKHTEEALRHSEERFREITENMRDMVCKVDARGDIRYASPSFQSGLGYKPDSLIGEPFTRWIHPDELECVESTLHQTLSEGLPNETNLRIRHQDGRYIWAHVLSNPIRDAEGAIVGGVLSGHDITERMKAESEIRMLAHTVQSISECVSITDPSDSIIYVNDAFCRTYGYTAEEATGKNIAFLRSPQNDPEVLKEIRPRTLEGGWQGELLNRKKDGTEFPIALSTSIIRNSSGEMVAFVGVASDISSRKLAEEALRFSEQRYRNLSEAAFEGIGIGEHDTLVEVNDQFSNLLGRTRQELIGAHLENLVAEDQRALVRETVEAAHEGPVEFVARRADGTFVPVEMRTRTMRIGGRQFRVFAVRDVTDRRRAEEQQKRRLAEVGAIYQLTAALAAASTMEEVYKEALDAVRRTYHTDRVAVSLYGTDGLLRFAAWNRLSDAYRASVLAYSPWSTEETDPEPVIGLDIETADFGSNLKARLTAEGIRSIAFIPLVHQKKLIGRLTIYFDEPRTIVDTQIAETIARHVAFAIERRRVEEALRESERRYRTLAEAAQDSIFIIDRDDRIGYLNDYAARQLGGVPEQFLGQPRSALFRLSTAEGQARSIEQIFKSASSVYVENRTQFLEREAWLGTRLVPMFGEDGQVYAVMGISRDITEQRRAQETIRQSEARLAQVIDLVPHLIFAKDIDGHYILGNRAMADIYGTTTKELLGKTDADFVQRTEEARQFREDDLEVIRTGKMKVIEEEQVTDPAGNLRYMHTIKIPFTLSGSDSPSMLGVATDITDRKLAMLALAKSEQKYRTIFENIQDVFYQADAGGTITTISPSVKRYSGFLPEELIGHQISDMFVAPEERAALLQTIFDSGEAIDFELRLRHRDNHIVHVSINARLIRDASGIVQGFEGTLRDVSERKAVEAELQKLSRAVNQSPSGVSIMDLEGMVEYMNTSMTAISGYPREEVLGRKHRLLSKGLVPDKEDSIMSVLRQGHEWQAEFLSEKKDGEPFWTSVSFSPIKNDRGEITHILAVEDDVTDRKRAEQELIDAKERAERSDKLKDAFIANISHEIRTPLNIVMGFNNVIQEALADRIKDEEHYFFDSVERGGKRLMRTVEQILSISSLQTGSYTVRSEPVNVGTQLARLIQDMRPLARKQGLSLQFRPGETGAWILADEYSFDQAFTNLIENAIKYTPEGEVRVTMKCDADEVCVTVADTGIGISDSYLPHIFDVFSQEASGYTRPYEGIGLGLALTKRYVELNRGAISVKSTKGKGTTFTISFRRGEAPPAPAARPRASKRRVKAEPPPLRQPSILIVEDDPESQRLLGILLSKSYMLHAATTVEEAWGTLHTEQVDLVLMDLSLHGPDDGLELTRRIRRDDRIGNVLIIAVTAHAFPKDRENSLAAGCNEYLSKPFHRSELLSLVENILRTRHDT